MLGPPVCISCEILADYHPNLQNPGRQGDWICPHCNDNFGVVQRSGEERRDRPLFLWSDEEQFMIAIVSTIERDNRGTELSNHGQDNMSNIERLLKCAERIEWFIENNRDTRAEALLPYANTISVLVTCIEHYKDVPDVLIAELEDVITRAESDCKPEDADHFVYDQDFKLK